MILMCVFRKSTALIRVIDHALIGSRDGETKKSQEDPTQNLLTHPERTRLEPASRQRIRGRSEGKHVCFHLVFAAANVD